MPPTRSSASRSLPSLTAVLAVAAFAAGVARAQDPLVQTFNWRWVASGQHAVTTNWYPVASQVPPGYPAPPGVAPGTRTWFYTPGLRFQAGHAAGRYLTLTGMTQNIHVGAATTAFPATGCYQFKTGIAPAAPVAAPHGFEHAATGADVVSFPSGTINVTAANNWRHSFTLATPIVIPQVELMLFVEYRGGESREDPINGQTCTFDWQGGSGLAGATFAGHTVGQNPRTVMLVGSNYYLPQIGLIVREPILTATGFHGNLYYQPPFANEDYRSVNAAYADWSTNGTPDATLFFHLDAGGAFANGSATVLANLGRTPFAGQIPTPLGTLLVFPLDPLFTVFPDAGLVLMLDPAGQYATGMANAITVPALGTASIGLVLKLQGIVVDQNLKNITLTSASGVKVR